MGRNAKSLSRTPLALAFLAAFLLATPASGQLISLVASGETDPVPGSGDAADDPAIWVHPDDPSLSLVLGTDKFAGLFVYDVAGQERQLLPGAVNNVDVLYQFPLGGTLVDLAVASRNADGTLAVFRIDPATLRLEDATAGPLSAGIPVYGICFYRSPQTGRTYAVVNSKPGQVRQFELLDDGNGRVVHQLVRSFALASEVEGCVADQDAGWLYIGEENAGIWRYPAEPQMHPTPVLVAPTQPAGPLVADVEGLSIYYGPGTEAGYLLASSQGSDEYVVYRRAPPNAYVGRFRIVAGGGFGATEGTDGIDVTHASLGPLFPQGVFVAQDGENAPLGQNFKLVPWERIATAFFPPLVVDASRPLRWTSAPGACVNGVDDDADGATDYPSDPGCWNPYSASEAPQCDDGVDNDGDAQIDFGADPHCAAAWDSREAPNACGLGAEAGIALAALRALRRRRRS